MILTGFMGSGKSVVGLRLARELGMEFIDTDVLVERRMGMSILDAFDKHGESYFRAQEEAVISETLDSSRDRDEVIALGGGAIESEGVRAMLEPEPFVIHLEVDADTALERVSGSGRPLARERDEFVRLHRERKPVYESVAAFEVDTGQMDVEGIIAAIREFLEEKA